MGSKSSTATETRYDQRTSNTTIGQELSDQALGLVGDNNDVDYNYTATDHGAIEAAGLAVLDSLDFARDSQNSASDTVNNALLTNENVTSDALASNESIASNALITGENMLSDSLGFGRDAIDAVSMNAAESINAQLEASGMMSDLANNALMSSEIMLGDSLMFAGNQNQLLADTLGENANLTQEALLSLADNQERGLDSALDVAKSVAVDDNVEGAIEQTKYFAMAIGAVGVAVALGAMRK